ncbi:PD-(D/E)XK motif protein [Nitrosospira briensis]|uniref:PD-(D/E)XK motif protein n=1 Tax=Nitrosospira briensis TaxID=35799 RepID=UPI0008F25D32|nr:PD-(D/E)XK motif protein [Nitrosospira briensis]SFO12064.1 Putative PD-(D/E)XK family member [Nitrosospira briensis]
MARLSDEFLMAWSSLSGDGPDMGWQTISVTPTGPLELCAGRRAPDNAEAVLVGFPAARLAAADKLPEGQGFAIERANPEDKDMLWLALTRKAAGNVELFIDMVCNVTGALDGAVAAGADVAKLLRVFVGRVGAWQEFMRKGSQILSPEAEIGLVGELATLLQIIEAGVSAMAATEGWLGPLDGAQDFELGTGALEVKSTLSSAGFPARIGSLDQLDDSLRQPLFVVGVRLRQTESGLGLSDFVDAARLAAKADPGAASALDDRFVAAGYFDAHANHYPRRFALVDTLVIEVGDGFPRFTVGGVPFGITGAAYGIDLEKVVGHCVDVATALKKMRAI